MKLKRFNESSDEDQNLDIIRDAFYNITDTYPLEVTFNLFRNRGYLNIDKVSTNDNDYTINLSFKVENKYKHLELLENLIKQCNISVSYLKSDFTLCDLSVVTYSDRNIRKQSISIRLSKIK